MQQVPQAKAMISVVSPPFIRSEICRREVEQFWHGAEQTGGRYIKDKARLLKVLKTAVSEQQMPRPLLDIFSPLFGFEFFELDAETGRVREFDETFGPVLKQRFFETVLLYNSVVYPVGVVLWVRRIFSLRALLHRLCKGSAIDSASLTQARRRLIHLPWFAAAICGVAWFLCIPVFIGALVQVQNPLDPRLLWHLPISFCVSGFIAVTHSFFLVELASHWGLFPVFFRDARADRPPA